MSVAVVFPGQGSQSVGMGLDFMSVPSASAVMEKADGVLGYSLSKIMFEGSEDTLRLTENTQPALLLHSSVLWMQIKDKLSPAYFAGHSLGEYSALVSAGGIDLYDALLAVHNRGKFMQSAVPVGVGGMTAVLGSKNEDIADVCRAVSKEGSVVEPANYNSDAQVVVAGHMDALERFAPAIKERGAKRTMPLPVSAPFHCSLMKPAGEKMAEYLKNVNINTLKTPVVNNIEAQEETEPDEIRDALVRQISGAVKWSQSVRYMIDKGVDTFIEVGEGAVLTGLIKKIDRNVKCINISTLKDIEKL